MYEVFFGLKFESDAEIEQKGASGTGLKTKAGSAVGSPVLEVDRCDM
jgi:hypothetical protein